MRPVILPLILLLTLGRAQTACTQERAPAWNSAPAVVLPHAYVATEDPDPRPVPMPRGNTYWKEGGVIGAVLLGIIGAVLLDGICGDNSAGEHCGTETVGGAVIGAGVGFAAGALIGAQFPKGP
jgi:uncharacterized membrane protein YeaQ/YmgE (transglycosylase-associated protein family)